MQSSSKLVLFIHGFSLAGVTAPASAALCVAPGDTASDGSSSRPFPAAVRRSVGVGSRRRAPAATRDRIESGDSACTIDARRTETEHASEKTRQSPYVRSPPQRSPTRSRGSTARRATGTASLRTSGHRPLTAVSVAWNLAPGHRPSLGCLHRMRQRLDRPISFASRSSIRADTRDSTVARRPDGFGPRVRSPLPAALESIEKTFPVDRRDFGVDPSASPSAGLRA